MGTTGSCPDAPSGERCPLLSSSSADCQGSRLQELKATVCPEVTLSPLHPLPGEGVGVHRPSPLCPHLGRLSRAVMTPAPPVGSARPLHIMTLTSARVAPLTLKITLQTVLHTHLHLRVCVQGSWPRRGIFSLKFVQDHKKEQNSSSKERKLQDRIFSAFHSQNDKLHTEDLAASPPILGSPASICNWTVPCAKQLTRHCFPEKHPGSPPFLLSPVQT